MITTKLLKWTRQLYNSFINWYYKKELADTKKTVQFAEIDNAIYALDNLKKKINPKTDAIIKLEKELNLRLKPFKKGVKYQEQCKKHDDKYLGKYKEVDDL